MSLPKIQDSYYPFGGGVDMLTPAIALKEGFAIDAQNYEPEISGGYRRIDGYERYDGRPAPSAASYWVMTANITGTINVGNTITGVPSGAIGRVLAVAGTTLVLGRVTGTFGASEALQVSGVTQATSTSVASQSGSTDAKLDSDYTALAAADTRLDIQVVPGAGPIRGVWVYRNVVYAFRDNVGQTAGNMWRASSTGWVQVQFATEIPFSSAVGDANPIAVGSTIGNAASPSKTATVLAVLVRTGTMGTDAVGTLVVTPVTGSFANTDPIYVGATQKGVCTGAATQITRAPGGTMEFVNGNFSSSTNTLRMYGVDGVNPCFEYDSLTGVYVPIHTGMAVDTPTHVMFHRFYLFLSFKGSVQFSAITNPYAWAPILGAGEIALADDVTGFVPQGGTNAGSSMAIFTSRRTYILYGSSAANWNLVLSIFELGYAPYTMQPVSNNTYGITPRGIQCLLTTLTYGDFDYASVAHAIQPFLTSRRGLEIASTSLRAKDQYRLYFSDGYAVSLGLTGDKVSGCTFLNYNRAVRCIVTATLDSGKEVTYFGSDDGYVYQDNIGTSQDGSPIEAWVRLPFNHNKSPQTRKRYRRAVLEVKVIGYTSVNIAYDLDYGSPDVNPSAPAPDQVLVGGGAYYEQGTWDQFTWDSKVVSNPVLSIEGTEKNISFIFYSNSANYPSHTLQGITLFYTPQRAER
jgi:hypothetical protein